VPGGAVGVGLADELADGLGDGDGLGLGVVALGVVGLGAVSPGGVALDVVVLGVVVPGVLALGVLALGVVGPGVLLEVVALGVPLSETVGVADLVPPSGNEGGVVDGEPDEQADTDAGASMAKAAQPRTVPRKCRRP
jgi:hypothetical protein